MSASLHERPYAAASRTDRRSDPIHVVIAIDRHYARGAAVTVRSLLDSTTRPDRIRVHVLDTGLTREDRARLTASWKGASPPKFIDALGGRLHELGKVPIASHVTLAGYARLLMPELFPDLKQVWWADSDLIFQGDLVKFNDSHTGEKPIAAVVNNATPIISSSRGVRNWQATKLDPTGPFLQSGFQRMDLEKLRAMNFIDRVFDIAERYRGDIKGGDQEIMNRIFGRELGGESGWDELPREWNDVELHFADLGRTLQRDRIIDNPSRPRLHAVGAETLAPLAKVIHVTEIPKVWDKEYWGPVLRAIYDDFESRTAWSGEERLPLGGRSPSQADYVSQVRDASRAELFLP